MKLYRKNARIEILKKIVKENTGKYMPHNKSWNYIEKEM